MPGVHQRMSRAATEAPLLETLSGLRGSADKTDLSWRTQNQGVWMTVPVAARRRSLVKIPASDSPLMERHPLADQSLPGGVPRPPGTGAMRPTFRPGWYLAVEPAAR